MTSQHGSFAAPQTITRSTEAFTVIAEWDGTEDETYPVGPQRLMIELTGETTGGITSGLLRRAGRHLGDMTGEFNQMPSVGGYQTMVRQYTEDRVTALPHSGMGYHRGLLDILDDLTGRGHAEPEKALAAAMRVPAETLNASLQVARQRLSEDHA